MRKKGLLLAALFLSSVSNASSMRDLTGTEISNLNWLLQCPNEIAELTKNSEKIESGVFFSDRNGSKYSYKFFRRIGFSKTEYAATLNISRIRRINPPTDAPSYTVECEITKETL